MTGLDIAKYLTPRLQSSGQPRFVIANTSRVDAPPTRLVPHVDVAKKDTVEEGHLPTP